MHASAATAEPRVLVPLRLDAGSVPALGARVHELQGRTMGTRWSLRAAAGVAPALPAWRRCAEAVFGEVIAQMSHWEPDALLSRYNRAPAGSWVPLPSAFRTVLDCALKVAQASGGAFDPAAGALVERWGFGARAPHFGDAGFQAPNDEAVADALALGGWQRLRYADGQLLQPGGLQLDFSAIAKGYAVDLLLQELRGRCRLKHLLVEVGGELRGQGLRPDGQPWWVEIAAPPGARLRRTRVALHGLAIATSGDDQRFFTDAQGHRCPHSIDPRSGRPIANGLASVSVLHESCMWADAWSTALTVLGPEAGLELARERQLAALFVLRRADGGWTEIESPALQDLMG